jgi:hypothetical protein
MIQKILKLGSGETAVLLVLNDAQLDDLAAFLHSLGMHEEAKDNPFNQPSADYSKVVELIQRTAPIGEPMTPGKQKRIREVLGTNRADSLFGPNYGASSWDLFVAADPLRLVKTPDGGYKQVANDKHNPLFLSYLLKLPGESVDSLSELRKAKSGGPREVEVDSDWDPDTIWSLIREGSKQGRPMSSPQVDMINRVMPGSFEHWFVGAKSGSIDLFMALMTKRRKNQEGGWEDNPNYRADAFEFAARKIQEQSDE